MTDKLLICLVTVIRILLIPAFFLLFVSVLMVLVVAYAIF